MGIKGLHTVQSLCFSASAEAYSGIFPVDNQLKLVCRVLPRALIAKPFSEEPSVARIKRAMEGKPLRCTEAPADAFYQSTDNVFALRTFGRVTPLKTRLSAYCKCLGRLRKLFRVT